MFCFVFLNLATPAGKGEAATYVWSLEDPGDVTGETSKSQVMESLELGKDTACRPLRLVQGNKTQPLPSGTYSEGSEISLGPGLEHGQNPLLWYQQQVLQGSEQGRHIWLGNQGGFLEEGAGNLVWVKRLPICCCSHIPSFFVPPCLCTYCSFPRPPSPFFAWVTCIY